MKTFLFNSLLSIANANPNGFTVSFYDLHPVKTGYAVAVAATQNSFGPEGLKKVIDFVAKNSPSVNAFGGWYNNENKQYYFDATIVCTSEAEAKNLAIINNQIAYFNLNTCTEIRCK